MPSDILAFGDDVPGGVSHVLRSIGILGSAGGAFLASPIGGGLRYGRLGLALGLRHEPEVPSIADAGMIDCVSGRLELTLKRFGPRF